MRVIVDSSDGKYLTAYGAGLNQGASGEELEFFVTGTASQSLIVDDAYHHHHRLLRQQGSIYDTNI